MDYVHVFYCFDWILHLKYKLPFDVSALHLLYNLSYATWTYQIIHFSQSLHSIHQVIDLCTSGTLRNTHLERGGGHLWSSSPPTLPPLHPPGVIWLRKGQRVLGTVCWVTEVILLNLKGDITLLIPDPEPKPCKVRHLYMVDTQTHTHIDKLCINTHTYTIGLWVFCSLKSLRLSR